MLKANKYFLYAHTTPEGGIYIGQSRDPETRWGKNGGGYRENKLFYKAIEFYGWNNIQHDILDELTIDNITVDIDWNIKIKNCSFNHLQFKIKEEFYKELVRQTREMEDDLIYKYNTLNPLYGFNTTNNHGERFIWTIEKQNIFMENYISGELNNFLTYIMEQKDWRIILNWSNLICNKPKDNSQIAFSKTMDQIITYSDDID